MLLLYMLKFHEREIPNFMYPNKSGPFPLDTASYLPNAASCFGNGRIGSTFRSDASTSSASDLNSLCKEYTYRSLSDATGGFHASNILGKGSFGAVYRGTLEDQTDVAIKVISNPSASGFEDEVRMLIKYRHPNLVMLLGYGRNENQRLLVFEYLDNGDCERRIRNPELSRSFTWHQRLSVLLDACRGIAFMTSSRPAAFHRDIKPSNILLDRTMKGKVADFGLARELPSLSTSSVRVNNTAGTIGYACQHYVKTAIVSEATEVYSFGICMLEFLSNQPPAIADPLCPNKVRFLVDTIQGSLPKLISLVDRTAGWPDAIVLNISELILQCISRDLTSRPSFCTVVKNLRYLNEKYTQDRVPECQPDTGLIFDDRNVAKPHSTWGPLPGFRPLLQIQNELEHRGIQPAWPRVRLEIAAFPIAVDTRYVAVEFSDNRFKIGRGHQAVIFNAILMSEQLRLCVSRDHFSISRLGTQWHPKFIVENLSGNGTYIEGKGMLETKGDKCEIAFGDVIKLVQTNSTGVQVAFIQILFTSERSMLN